jgi:predicted nucleic acid-binding protein
VTRAILDTNVLVSAVIFRGLPLTLLKYAGDRFELIISQEILAELAAVLQTPKI